MVNQRMGSGIAGDALQTVLNTTANNTQAVLESLSGPTFIFGLSEDVTSRLITFLQDFLQSNSLGKTLRERLGKVNKEVIVQDQYTSMDSQLLPQIVVTSVPVDGIPLSFGNRLGEEIYMDHLYVVYGGNVLISASLEIYDSGKRNVCELADLVFLSLMEYIPGRMKQVNMTVQPQVKFTKATKANTAVGGEVYVVTVSVPIIAEWRQYMEVNAVSTTQMRTEATV